MKLTITPRAQQWFKEEVGVTSDSGIRFYGKIYGKTDVHEGFSIAMSVEAPDQPLVKEEIDGITYFIEETDDWFFKGYDLLVDYDEEKDEPKYKFAENKEDLKQ
ncbi:MULTISPECIES: HesB/YadR/YfhF family protein [Enterococcus]|uniref:Iron-sulfur cluster biosynthesis protein n=2 Tax=Enterococcus TaxID=1350 RepID=A0ABZ2T8H9_9ENTE|nr:MULTISPECIES: iron-sulfur cluster biosynthesis protein [Enterococcus]ALS35900.1 iron-sulfur cluster biosynthesis protein [Enterococcus rotai]OTN89471.1 iron-sulfur cluster biosynthesis family protein [Enterococcus sp. 7E2_DIV0204]OTO68320.1 iron-sulfur cluster biosynthesis family protein [Enterococcus sp. 12C11_DIV0727]OTP51925.1 iron-sulfur cluster biosynthesis family protein [Enterococcus sp. 7D2_DIV0200]